MIFKVPSNPNHSMMSKLARSQEPWSRVLGQEERLRAI